MPKTTVAAIVKSQDKGELKILLTLRKTDPLKGYWCLPGGHIDPYESALTAIRREVKEEVGLSVTVGPLLMSVSHAYSHFRVTLHAFHCRSKRGRARALMCSALKWVTVPALSEYPFPSGSARIIRRLQQGPGLFDREGVSDLRR